MVDLLGDTNILLRMVNTKDVQHELVVGAVRTLRNGSHRILYAPQSLREFWNVVTRPAAANGLGYSISEADALARRIEATFEILHDTEAMHQEWRRLVVQHEVKGVQVHDARLAAAALVAGCRAILTLNDPDFKRFGIYPLHPRDAQAFLTGADRATG